jgi:type IV pilus assembly protein PilA
MNTVSAPQRKGFTLLEILLVIAAIGILAAIVLIAINPTRQLAQARNAQRRADVLTIINAVSQKIIDDASNGTTAMNVALVDGTVYAMGTATTLATCGTTPVVTGATANIDLTSQLAPTYVASIPVDPSAGSLTCTGYTVTQAATDGRLTVTAPRGATDAVAATISVTR